MGQIFSTRCRFCSFTNTFIFGGNKSNYKIECSIPAINLGNFQFENVNYFETSNDLNYILYSDDFLKGENHNGKLFKNFNLELNAINNYCPKCRNYTFDFYLCFFTD